MSDAAGLIDAALEPIIRSDAGVIAAFGVAKVRIYNLAPPASSVSLFPYVTLGLGDVTDEPYEGIDASDYEWQGHVWSRPDPRSTAEAARIASAVKAAAVAAADTINLAGFVVVQAIPLRTQYLEDPDGLTIHAVIRVQFSTDPA